jgi:hypothetical protein
LLRCYNMTDEVWGWQEGPGHPETGDGVQQRCNEWTFAEFYK